MLLIISILLLMFRVDIFCDLFYQGRRNDARAGGQIFVKGSSIATHTREFLQNIVS